MFGYVRPALGRLDQEQRDAYQSVYCGLCHALGRRHGPLARLTLRGVGSGSAGGAPSTPCASPGAVWRGERWTPPPTRV